MSGSNEVSRKLKEMLWKPIKQRENSKMTFYIALSLLESASLKDIDRAYLRESLKFHPDIWIHGTYEQQKEAENRFKLLATSLLVLQDTCKREKYNQDKSSGFHGSVTDTEALSVFAQFVINHFKTPIIHMNFLHTFLASFGIEGIVIASVLTSLLNTSPFDEVWEKLSGPQKGLLSNTLRFMGRRLAQFDLKE